MDTSAFPVRQGQRNFANAESYITAHRAEMSKVVYHSQMAMFYISGGVVKPDSPHPASPSDFYDMRPWFALQYSDGDYVEGFITNPVLVEMPKDTLVDVVVNQFAANPRGYGMRPMGKRQVEHIIGEFKKAQAARAEALKSLPSAIRSYAAGLLVGEVPQSDTFANLQYCYSLLELSYWGGSVDNVANKYWTTHSLSWANAAYDVVVGDMDGLRAHASETNTAGSEKLKKLLAPNYTKSGSLYTNAAKITGNHRAIANYIFTRLLKETGSTMSPYGDGVTVYYDFAPSVYVDKHSPGAQNFFNLAVTNQLHHQAYLGQTPAAYWTHMLSHRLVFEQLSDSASESGGYAAVTKVTLHEADMNTGGIKQKSRRQAYKPNQVLAILPLNPTEAAMFTRRYLPDVPVYNPGYNPQSTSQLSEEYKETVMTPEMRSFANDPSSKSTYQYAYVLDNSWTTNERSFITPQDVAMAKELRGETIGTSSTPAQKELFVKEQFSPTLRHHRGVSQSNIIFGGQSFLGPLESWQAREADRWGVLPNWASQSTVSAQKMYSTYSSISAAEALPWPQSVKDAVLAGKGAAWKATITACAAPNAEIESAREFLTNGVPAEVASILTRARNNWVNFFSSYPDNTKLQRKAQLYTRGTGAWEVREAQQMAAFFTHLSSRLESYFIDPASAWEFLADHGALAEAGSYNVTPGYGGLYDDYMGLIGAIAYLGSGGALMGSGYPTFLTSSQLGRTKAYVRSAIGKDAFSTIKLGSFAINDTQDIYSVHNLMKETNVIVGMKEMEVLDLPQFHIRWQTSDGTEAMTEAPTFTSNWKYRNDYNSAAMGTLSLPFPAPNEARAYKGKGTGVGSLFHAQMVQTATLYNRLSMSWGPTTVVSSNVRIPLNTPGLSGGYYGLTANKAFPLSTVASADSPALKISTPFKLTRADTIAGGSLIYAGALVAALLYNTSRRRYV